MRPSVGLHTSGDATAAMPPYSASRGAPQSAWRSPAPYLFCGLAAMLGLVAFSLLILVCSYWKLPGFLGSADEPDGDAEAPGGGGETSKPTMVLEESIVVIMAGECKPTFLATPTAGRADSFNDDKSDEDGNATVGAKKALNSRRSDGNDDR
ncbi:protein GLUTAMINE DUMPER 3-like [Canna indica]|uniref:Protein GLUTAMINE DUMPER 3-like n=1 Tax=Canna indica TaxID=4628 RepID=A0AAQ3L0M1_9LILI|nr:protein GLUTAMINE DUMPER 3-like [Canna indica]